MYRLLTVEEIRSGLRNRFAEDALKYPDHFASLIPEASSEAQATNISDRLAEFLGSALPPSFVAGMCEWNLGCLELAGINFGRTGDFVARVKQCNKPAPGTQWWEDQELDDRPPGLLMIGQGDPHVVLLEQSTGRILAYVADEGSASCALVAPNLSMFLRGLGSVSLHPHQQGRDTENLTNDLVTQIGTNVNRAFWYELAIIHADA
ncbi:hypothetical protein [uncultured Dechloromonas sp.]|uniref:hypothetical protein n=1 Tax=uncultured Dechloromonas sp. TaxID=171719 RepID=UPI0025E4041E|nr:hypothetical protein [uncultured Dechloromonas sp.]